MIEEIAAVVGLDGKYVQLESEVKSTCSSCQQIDNCGSGQISKAIPHKRLTLTLLNEQNLTVGDKVVIGIPQTQLLSSAWQVYGLPLIGFIAFALIGHVLGLSFDTENELLSITFAFFGGWCGFRIAHWLQTRPHCQAALRPKVLRKHDETIKVMQIQP